MHKLQYLPNKAIKIVFRKYTGLSIDQLHAEAKLLKLADRRNHNLLKSAIKVNSMGFLDPALISRPADKTMNLRSNSQIMLKCVGTFNENNKNSLCKRGTM